MTQAQPVQESNGSPPSREGDALIVITQTNSAQTLVIEQMNASAEAMLGYRSGEMLGQSFGAILSERTYKFLCDELEFVDDAPDLGDVLSKQREIRLRDQRGAEIVIECSVTRLMSKGMSACFQIIIPNERDALARQKIRDFISLNLDGRTQLDELLGIPNRQTAEVFLPLLENYLANSGIAASFAIMRMDRFEKSMARYGHAACMQLLQHLSNCCRACFRSEDMVFMLTPQTLGVVLFDISRESARLVFNRLRWNIRNHHIEFGEKSNFSVTATIIFDMMETGREHSLLERSESAASAVGADERNALLELGN